MNQKLKDLMPKKIGTGNFSLQSWDIYNEAIDDCLDALENANVGIVPSEEDLINIFCEHYTLSRGDFKEYAKAIRNLMLGKDTK